MSHLVSNTYFCVVLSLTTKIDEANIQNMEYRGSGNQELDFFKIRMTILYLELKLLFQHVPFCESATILPEIKNFG